MLNVLLGSAWIQHFKCIVKQIQHHIVQILALFSRLAYFVTYIFQEQCVLYVCTEGGLICLSNTVRHKPQCSHTDSNILILPAAVAVNFEIILCLSTCRRTLYLKGMSTIFNF